MPSYVDSSATEGTGTTLTTTLPAAATAGDLVVICASSHQSGSNTFTWDSGWTAIPNSTSGGSTAGGFNYRFEARYRILQSGDSAPSLTASIMTSGSWATVRIAYRGVDPGSPIVASDMTVRTTASSASITTPSVSGTSNWRVSAFSGAAVVGTRTWGSYSPADTERHDISNTSATLRSALALADSNGSVDTSGGTTVAATPSGSQDAATALIFLLRDAPLTKSLFVNQAVYTRAHYW